MQRGYTPNTPQRLCIRIKSGFMTVFMPVHGKDDVGVEISVRGVCREYPTQSRHEQHSESA
jgi:hypothetical protein